MRKLACLLVLMTTSLAFGQTTDRYVSTAGNDSTGDGLSPSTAWRTISHAAKLAQPGWTVHVLPGTYSENVSAAINGTASQHIRFVSDTKWAAKIQAVSAGSVVQWGSGSTQHNGNYIDTVGFEVVGIASSDHGIDTYGSNNLIQGNKVHDVGGNGCGSSGGGGIEVHWNGNSDALQCSTSTPGCGPQTNNVIDSNMVFNIGGYPGYCGGVHGMYISTPLNLVENNIIFNISGYGYHVYHYVTNETLVNNLAFNVNEACIIISSSGEFGMVDDFTVVNNNIAVNCNRSASGQNGGIRETSFGPSDPGNLYIGTHNVYSNNLTYGNNPGNYNLARSTPINSVNSGTNATVFVNYTGDQTGDYHLKSGSSAIGAATSSNSPNHDFDGHARPFDSRWDIGSYEFDSNTATAPQAPTGLVATVQ